MLKLPMGRIKVIVFDHDGVIVRLSELVKQGAWGFVAHHPDIGDRAVVAEAEVFYGRAKGNRYDILKRVFERLGKSAAEIPVLVAKHAERFNQVVQEGIRSLGVLPEDRAALEALAKKYPLYVNTGTPEEAIRETLERNGIRQCFKAVLGQPQGKVENLMRVLAAERITPGEMVFVGDSAWDHEAAEEVGCRFIGLANLWNGWQEQEKPFPLVSSLGEIVTVIESAYGG